MLEKTLESPLDCKEIQPAHPKGNQSWMFIGRTDAEAETPILWPPDVKSWLIGKDPDAGKDRMQKKGVTEDETVRWHHQLNGHEFEQALGDGKGQGILACCSPWGHKELDMIEWLNDDNNKIFTYLSYTLKNCSFDCGKNTHILQFTILTMFKCASSLVLRIFTLLYKQPPNLFQLAKLKLDSCINSSPSPLSSQPLVITVLLSISRWLL